jgi:hypothetical protein
MEKKTQNTTIPFGWAKIKIKFLIIKAFRILITSSKPQSI